MILLGNAGLWAVEKQTDKPVVIEMRKNPSATRVIPVKANDVRQHVEAVKRRTNDLEQFAPVKIARRPSIRK